MSHKNLKMSKHNITECQKFQNFNQKCQKCHPKLLKCRMSKTPSVPPILKWLFRIQCIVHSLSSGKFEMFL